MTPLNSAVDILPRFVGAAFHEFDRKYTVPRHQHATYEILYLHQGRYACLVNEVKITMSGGHLIIIQPGDWHTDLATWGNVRMSSLLFTLHRKNSGKTALIFVEGISPEDQRIKAARGDFHPLFTNIHEAVERGDRIGRQLTIAYLQVFFWSMVKALPSANVNPELVYDHERNQFERRFTAYVMRHLTRNPGLDEMAAVFHMSRRSFIDTCRDHLGLSPHKSFLKWKMGHAAEMLVKTTMSVKEISDYLGYANPYHFSRLFKNHFNKSPRHFREPGKSPKF